MWFKVGNILDFREKLDYKTECYIPDYKTFSEDKRNTIDRVMDKLYSSIVEQDRISYYEEESDSLDKILNIFIRINSGGTVLGYTYFLMSMIINQWGDGREEINNKLDNINDECNFAIPKDIFLRGCLYLTNEHLVFTADNFKQKTITSIKINFSNIVKYIKASCSIFNQLGYTKDNLKSNLIILPLAQFLMQTQKEKIDGGNLTNIRKWIQLSILTRAFGFNTTSYLIKLRDIIRNKVTFPIDEIMHESAKSRKSMQMNKALLEEIIDSAKYGSQDAWSLLTLLYPNYNYENVRYNEDHIFPSAILTDSQKRNGGNFVANLQLLEHTENCESKRDQNPEMWLNDFCNRKELTKEQYKKDNFMSIEYDLELNNFEKFITDRRNNILKRLMINLNIPDA